MFDCSKNSTNTLREMTSNSRVHLKVCEPVIELNFPHWPDTDTRIAVLYESIGNLLADFRLSQALHFPQFAV